MKKITVAILYALFITVTISAQNFEYKFENNNNSDKKSKNNINLTKGVAFLYLTTSGGSHPSEKWVNITTEVNGSGSVIWAQGNGTIGNGAGLLTDETITLVEGVTYYINCYDQYDDSWDGTTYELRTATLGGGTLICNNEGNSPNDNADIDGSGNWEGTPNEIESSEAFIYIPPQPNDLGIISLSLPLEYCNLSNNEDISFEIKNLGINNQTSVSAKYSTDNANTWSDFETFNFAELATGESTNLTFTNKANFSPAGIYDVQVELETDDNNLNNNSLGTVSSVHEIDLSLGDYFYGFEEANDNFKLTEEQQSSIFIDEQNGNNSLIMSGFTGGYASWTGGSETTTADEAWNVNTSSHATLKTCSVDATSLAGGLSLNFYLQQMYSLGTKYSWFRVLVNGNPISDVNGNENFTPFTHSSHQNPIKKLYFDISAYAGTEFEITFQSACKVGQFEGSTFQDIALIDSIKIQQTQQHDLALSIKKPKLFAENNVSIIPTMQIENNSLINSEANYSVDIIINNGTSDVYTWSSSTVENISNETTVAINGNEWTPTELGTYTITATVNLSGDEQINNNSSQKTFEVINLANAIYEQHNLTTHIGEGFEGSDISIVQSDLGMTFSGINFNAKYNVNVSDEFIIPLNEEWKISGFIFYAYQTNAPSNLSTFSEAKVKLYSGKPSEGGELVYDFSEIGNMVNSSWTGIYRISDYAGDPSSISRPIMKINFYTPEFTLPPGEYWLEWSAYGSDAYSGPWTPPVTILGQTNTGNAIQFVNNAWRGFIDTGNNSNQGACFDVLGLSEPLSVTNNLREKIKIFPNPTSGIFTIKNLETSSNPSSISNIEITDITGKTIKQLSIDNYQLSIDLTNQPSGIYFIKINIAKETFVSKLILK